MFDADEIVVHGWPLIGRAFMGLLYILWWCVSEFFWELLLEGSGWCLLRLISFGHYPPTDFRDLDDAASTTEEILIVLAGFSVWLVAAWFGYDQFWF